MHSIISVAQRTQTYKLNYRHHDRTWTNKGEQGEKVGFGQHLAIQNEVNRRGGLLGGLCMRVLQQWPILVKALGHHLDAQEQDERAKWIKHGEG